jgi:transposase-like protein
MRYRLGVKDTAVSDAPSFLAVMKWTDDECRTYLGRRRWPDGSICPKCGAKEPYTITRKSLSKNAVRSLYKCRTCKRQYTATVGTFFQDSHIPLSKWFVAIFLMVSWKKGISAHQLHRELGITYRAAWFMCHRVREARKDGEFSLLTSTIEADETHVDGQQRGRQVERERIRTEMKMARAPKIRTRAPKRMRCSGQ